MDAEKFSIRGYFCPGGPLDRLKIHCRRPGTVLKIDIETLVLEEEQGLGNNLQFNQHRR